MVEALCARAALSVALRAGIDLDRTAQKLYFTEIDASMVWRSNYDGSEREPVWGPGELERQAPSSVAVDHAADAIFITLEDLDNSTNGTLVRR